LFLDHDYASVLWCKVLSWLGISCPLPIVMLDHALQFCNAYMFSKYIKLGLQTIHVIGPFGRKEITQFFLERGIDQSFDS
jgi:hypothetical protein